VFGLIGKSMKWPLVFSPCGLIPVYLHRNLIWLGICKSNPPPLVDPAEVLCAISSDRIWIALQGPALAAAEDANPLCLRLLACPWQFVSILVALSPYGHRQIVFPASQCISIRARESGHRCRHWSADSHRNAATPSANDASPIRARFHPHPQPSRRGEWVPEIECSLAGSPAAYLRLCSTTGPKNPGPMPVYNNDYCKDKSRHLQQSCSNDKRRLSCGKTDEFPLITPITNHERIFYRQQIYLVNLNIVECSGWLDLKLFLRYLNDEYKF